MNKIGDRVRIAAPCSEWNKQWAGCVGKILSVNDTRDRFRVLVEQTKSEYRREATVSVEEIEPLSVVDKLAELA